MTPPFAGDTLRFCSRPLADSIGLWSVGAPSSAEIFGPWSQLAGVSHASPVSDTTGILYSISLLLCLVGWILIVYVYRDYILASLGIVRGGVIADKLLDKHNKLFGICLNWSVSLGGVALGLACSGNIVTACVCAAAVAGIWGFQWLVLAAAGRLTLYRDFTARLFYLRKIVAGAGSVVLVPWFLLYVLSGNGVLCWISLGLCMAFAIFLLMRTFMLFARERFSILLWILYLCGVEILPVLTMIIVAGKLRLF